MRILIFHGYLLRGTGSNIYNNNLAQALAGLGHEVHLLCQDRQAGDFGWVDAVGDWEDGELIVEDLRETPGEGSVTIYRPDIGSILPVYVEDPYEGFDARAYPRLDEEQVEHYISANVAAVHDVPGLVVQRTGTAAPAARRGRRSAYDAFLPSRASATAAAPLLESLLP